ncbi:glycosyltransferase [Stenotrophomonas sp. NRRL B-14846]|uniref:glycosyltransferase n=1 Tax=Stenotrophomonas sp. NRRL B-14846 TaxID=3162882 RepID=UPI003D2C43F3
MSAIHRAWAQVKRVLDAVTPSPRASAEGAGDVLPIDVPSVPTMPKWLQDEIFEIGYLDPDLVPPGDVLDRYQFYSVPSLPAAGAVYAELLTLLNDACFTHVLVIPWLKQGGADRGILYHAKAIVESKEENRLLLLGTEPGDSPWASRLPASAVYVSLGNIVERLSLDDQARVLVRLLVQQRPRVIHVINSRVGWEVVRQYGVALRQHSALYASLFCDDYSQRMLPVGYARDYLRDCHAVFDTIFCDNSQYPRIWNEDLGIPQRSFTVLPFPYDGKVPPVGAKARTEDGARRVLWAGRLDRQKRPDVLAGIAEAMPHVEFDVFGTQVMSGGNAAIERLKALPNVVLHGEFQRLEAVVGGNHFAYLHTSAWEGTPTILFDAASSMLPICAPAVGGILDFLEPESLIADYEDVAAFVSQLEVLRLSPQERELRVSRQLDMLRRTRQWGEFSSRLQAAGPYLRAGCQGAEHAAVGSSDSVGSVT